MFRSIKIYFSYTLSQDSTRGCIPAKQGRKEEMESKKIGMKYRQEAKGILRMTMQGWFKVQKKKKINQYNNILTE